ncbi:DUF4913 domain-containing protein [Streptomyces sp. NPDC056347]|uniref:DUF4913 domain-containing protein n=1 Tax=Streptomyces sp. NPDC056347 TaxID=3345790 RepID=UPI0035DBC0E3
MQDGSAERPRPIRELSVPARRRTRGPSTPPAPGRRRGGRPRPREGRTLGQQSTHTGPSVWHRDHMDPALRELRGSGGPFTGCTKGEHRLPGLVPSA